MTEDERKAEIDRLTRLLKVREGRSAFGQNVKAIKEALAALQEPSPTDG